MTTSLQYEEHSMELSANQAQTATVLTTPSRKRDHVALCVNDDVRFRAKTTGFERVQLEHNALPECNFSEIDTRTLFFGIPLAMPLMISSMTGGYGEAERINRELAELCEQNGLAMGVGSQRQALEDDTHHASFRVVRASAPHSFITANIGAPEIAKRSTRESLHRIVDLISANALTIHLNPLQELLQIGGNPDFVGVLTGIEECVQYLQIPIIVKEVGSGISRSVAERLIDVGVQGIDVAGAGGTSWAGVELLRAQLLSGGKSHLEPLWDWGIPTVECLRALAPLKYSADDDAMIDGVYAQPPRYTLIGSGGITSGFDIAKAIALGADLTASARPLIKTLLDAGQKEADTMIRHWHEQLRVCMFLTGARNISSLQNVSYILQ
jgi:isopentenyl-diphosphate Delta-isomerase